MDALTTSCIFCGRDRPLDADACPACGRGWIDVRLVDGDETSPPPPLPADESADDDDAVAAAGVAAAGAALAAVAHGTTGTSRETGTTPEEAGDTTDAAAGDAAAGAASGETAETPPGDEEPLGAVPDEEPEEALDPAEMRHGTPTVTVAAETTEPSLDDPLGAGRPEDLPRHPGAPPETDVVVIDPSPGGEQPTAGDAPDLAGATPPPRSRRRSQQLLIGGIVLGIVAVWFGVLAWITRDAGETDAGDDAAVVPTTVVDPGATTGAVPTTAPPDTTAPEPSTTTTSATTTTTMPPLESAGDPIPVSDLGLGAFALGPLDFGSPAALGRLVASFDQPDSVTPLEGGAQGLCQDETGFAAGWGPLTVIFTGTVGEPVLAGYRLDNTDPTHPASQLTTLSGLQLGDSVADLESTYADFRVAYQEVEGTLSFILVRTSDGLTLLWGPVSSEDSDGTVEGIYSPRPCDGGPTPTA